MIVPIDSLGIVSLIFGGCCSNVFTLEAIVKSEPSSGLIITFFQFVLASLAAYPAQIYTAGHYETRRPKVPLLRWVFVAAMFYTINMLNNWAFAFSISVPVHIILRSFGSVTTMLAGVIRGKRYSMLQVVSVMLLTVGVLVSAWADSESKGKSMGLGSHASTSEFTMGLGILLFAQLLSAYMGAFIEDTYRIYQAKWTENMFYSHALSLPLFLPLSATLLGQYTELSRTPPLDFRRPTLLSQRSNMVDNALLDAFITTLGDVTDSVPRGVLFLFANALTQLACISGVNLLSAKSSAVTVTIILNIRKLVSFIFSTILFGHHLSAKMMLGSTLVFGSGALYGWETSWRLPEQRRKKAKAESSPQANGSAEKKD